MNNDSSGDISDIYLTISAYITGSNHVGLRLKPWRIRKINAQI